MNIMKNYDALKLLRENPIFWSRLGFCYDPPIKDENGEPVVFCKNFKKYESLHKNFSDNGIKLHTSIVHLGWMGEDEYDYSLTDKTLETIFQVDEEILFIPRIKMNVPNDWCYNNPEEVFVYENGPRTAEEIRALVNTEKQDWLGYDAPDGYYLPGGDYIDKRPNVGGVISRQSFSSKKWLCDAGVALEKFIDHVENGPFGDRILGYHIAIGRQGESVTWGRQNEIYGDYGISQLRNFYDYGLEKYGSAEVLKEKWQQPNLTRDNVYLPSTNERYYKTETLARLFRGNPEDVIVTDYDEFMSYTMASANEHFGKIVKEKTNGKPVGCFYGYILQIDEPTYAGHLAIKQLLDSPYIDFFSAPMSYYRRICGQPGGTMIPAQSVNINKLWLEELDIRTHLSVIDWLKCQTLEESYTVMRREVAKNLSRQSGYWWMDLGDGWYDDYALIEEIGRLKSFSDQMLKKEHISQSDVLVVLDEESMYSLRKCPDMRKGFLEDFVMEAQLTGTLVDIYRLSDLQKLDLNQYKLVIFTYNFNLSPQQLKSLGFSKDTAFMFNYAQGINSDGFSVDNVEKLTGFKVSEYMSPDYNFPMLKVEGEKEKEVDGRLCFFNNTPYMKADEIRSIMEKASCHFYAPSGTAVYGDNRFIGIFPCKDINGALRFKEQTYVRELFSGESFESSEIPLDMKKGTAAIYMLDNR